MAQATSQSADLLPRERFRLDHLRTARRQGQMLKACDQTHGLSVSALYTARSTLKRRGVLSDPHHPARLQLPQREPPRAVPFEALLQVKIDGVGIGHRILRGDEYGAGIKPPIAPAPRTRNIHAPWRNLPDTPDTPDTPDARSRRANSRGERWNSSAESPSTAAPSETEIHPPREPCAAESASASITFFRPPRSTASANCAARSASPSIGAVTRSSGKWWNSCSRFCSASPGGRCVHAAPSGRRPRRQGAGCRWTPRRSGETPGWPGDVRIRSPSGIPPSIDLRSPSRHPDILGGDDLPSMNLMRRRPGRSLGRWRSRSRRC